MNADTTIMALLDENTVTLLGGGNNKLYEVDRTRLLCWTRERWMGMNGGTVVLLYEARGGIGIRCMRWTGHGYC
jgi:hypothetical protein